MVGLSMPLFVSTADCITRMQLDATLSGLADVVISGIIGSQLHVQQILRGKLQRQSIDCMFFLDGDAFSGIQPDGVFRVELPSGFIRQDVVPTITVSTDTTLAEITSLYGVAATATPFSDHEAIDMDYVKIDYDRGYLYIDKKYVGRYLRVLCDSGFEDGLTPTDTEGIDDYDEDTAYTVGQKVVFNDAVWRCIQNAVAKDDYANPPVVAEAPPDPTHWVLDFVPMEQISMDLYEAIMTMVPVIFNNSQASNRSNEAEKMYKTASEHAYALLQSWVRIKGFSLRPMWM